MIRPFKPGDRVAVISYELTMVSHHYNPKDGYFSTGRQEQFAYEGQLERAYTQADAQKQIEAYPGNPCGEIALSPVHARWFVIDTQGVRRCIDEKQLIHFEEWKFSQALKGIQDEANQV